MHKRYLLLVLISISAFTAFSQGTESFTNIPTTTPSSYLARTWTGDNGLTWNATDARTDQTINGKAIAIRVGSLTCSAMPNGIGNLTFTHKQVFSGSNPVLEVYINSVLVGTVNPTTTAATATINGINVSGNFNLEIKQVTSGLRVAIDDVTWTSFNSTPCDEPTAQPTNLNLTTLPTSITGNYTQIPDPTTVENYLVVRTTSPTLTALPVDGVNYAPGAAINGGNGTTVIVTSDISFTDNGLTPSTHYYYFIFAMNDKNCGGGPNYNQLSPLQADATTPAIPACIAPNGTISNLNLTAANTLVSGSFTGIADANMYLVVISASASLSATPTNGVTYIAGSAFGGGTIVSFSSGTSFSASGLTPSTQYYIFVFAANSQCTGEPYYNTTALTGNIVTTNNATGIPTGYYDAANSLTCQPLKTALRNIIANGYVSLSYTPGIWNAYQYTDMKRNDANTANVIWDIYSDNPTGADPYTFTYSTDQCGSYSGEGSCYNREHSTPKSWFNDAYPMYTDIQHLYPTDGYVNNKRDNFPYGEVTAATYTSQNGSKLGTGNNYGYTGTVFEPINEYKGDLARTSLYMATRYENEIIANNWSANGNADALFLSASDQPDAAERKLQIYDAWYLKTLFKWIGDDPVSQKEIDRNNAIYYQSGQNNRNPFIDHPEYAALIFQCTGLLPVTITDFTTTKYDNAILLKWYATYETNFSQYEIERSINANTFNKIGTVAGKNLADYSFSDNELPNTSLVYYRLKMIDADGKYTYSKTVVVKLNNNLSNAIVYPNPTAENLNIKLQQTLSANSKLLITDVAGRTIKQALIAAGTTNLHLDVKQLPAGRYFIKLYNNSQIITESFIVIK
jgi:endonuclease I